MHFSSATARRQRGITLVEMMVAMVVGLILLVGIVQLFVSNKQAYRIQEGANVLNENARYMLNKLQYDLRMADHWGGVEAENITIDDDVDDIEGDCDGAAAALQIAGIYGVDGDDASPLDCIPDADYVPGTDIVVVRYAEPIRRASGTLDVGSNEDRFFLRVFVSASGIVLQGKKNLADLSPDELKPANASATTVEEEADAEEADEDSPLTNYQLRTYVYFLRPCASQARGTAGECDEEDDNIPTLTRLSLEGTTLVQQDIISGVEQMQFAYGVDDNGDRSPDRYLSADDVTGADAWNKIIDVKMSVLIRNNEIDTTASDTSTYQLYGGDDGGSVAYTVPADARMYRRKLFNSSIQIRNMTRG